MKIYEFCPFLKPLNTKILTKHPRMSDEAIFKAVSNAVRSGDTGEALQQLQAFLSAHPKFNAALPTLNVLEANYNAVRQQQIKGIISPLEAQQQYNRLNDSLLQLLVDLQSGRSFSGQNQSVSNNSRRIWYIGGAVLLLLGIVIGMRFMRGGDKSFSSKNSYQCPEFEVPRGRVLLLPFQKVSGDDASPELLLQNRIREVARNNRFTIDVEILDDQSLKKGIDDNAARQIGNHCGADMVIFGLYVKEGSEVQLDANYVFTQKMIAGNTGFQKVQGIVGLKTEQNFKSLDDAVFSLCGIMAAAVGNEALARQWVSKVGRKDPRDQQLESMLAK